MSRALIYRPSGRGLTWVAFGFAAAIHLTAIAMAENESKPDAVGFTPGSFDPVVGIEDNSPILREERDSAPPEASPVMTDEFPQEYATPHRPRRKLPITSVARSIGTGTTASMRSGSAKALALFAPRPNYPYEARRSGTTGSGVAEVTVNFESGGVINASMGQSTGSVILDKETVQTLERWRFKPGVGPRIAVPITYTLTGVSY
jgi:TonB family protein